MMKQKEQLAYHVSLVTMLANLALSIGKLIVGFLSKSNAMISDGIHSASDVFSTVIVMIGIKLSSKESDKEHPYGHERLECVAALLLAMILFFTGAFIGYEGIRSIILKQNQVLQFTFLAMIVAVISIVVKEGMYWYTIKAAKQIHSNAMMADAWHHRSDALSSIGSLIGIIGFYLGYPIFDALASLVISLCIMKVAFDIGYDSICKMIDHSLDDEFTNQLIETVLHEDGILGIDQVKTRMFGNKIYIDLEICADGHDTLEHTHAIAHHVHDNIEDQFPEVKHCMIHVNPYYPK